MMYDGPGYIGYMGWRQTAYGKYTQRYCDSILSLCSVLSFVYIALFRR